jgi:hypothetical protein
MGESNQNQNLFLIEENQTNENEMYIEKDVERGESDNVQTENNKVEEKWERIMKKILQKLHVQRNFLRGHNINSLCWAFYCVNDGKEVEFASHQVMRCILCYSAIDIPNARTKKKKRINNLL